MQQQTVQNLKDENGKNLYPSPEKEDIEEAAIKELQKYLGTDINYRKPKNDPPDFLIDFNNKTEKVEITTINIHKHYLITNEGRIPSVNATEEDDIAKFPGTIIEELKKCLHENVNKKNEKREKAKQNNINGVFDRLVILDMGPFSFDLDKKILSELISEVSVDKEFEINVFSNYK